MNKKIDYVIGLTGVGILVMMISMGMLFEANQLIADTLYQQNLRGVSSDIVTIGIDMRSLDELGAWGTWPRSILGKLVQILNESETGAPAVIGLDIYFAGETNPTDDTFLAEVAKTYGNVVVAASADIKVAIDEEAGLNYMNVDYFGLPYQALQEAATYGHSNIKADRDGVIRRSLHKIENKEEMQYSFGYEVYKKYIEKIGRGPAIEPALDELNSWYIPFAGEVGEYSSGASVIEVLKGEKKPYVKDKIVLIGFDSPGAIDAYYTAANRREKMMGVEINANIIQSLLDNNTKQDVAIWKQILIIGGMVCILLIWIRRVTLKKAGMIVLVSVIGYGIATYQMYKLGYVMNVIYLPLMVGIAYLIKIISTYMEERMVRIMLSKKFEKYIRDSNIKYSKDIRELLNSFIDTISQAIDERSPHTANHTKAIVGLADEFVAYLNKCCSEGTYDQHFDEQRKEVLLMSASLHDIGKLVVPLKILEKSTRLAEKVESIEQRFELIQAKMEIAFLKGGISEDTYKQEVANVQEAIQFIKQVDRVGFLTDEMLEAIQVIGQNTYKNQADENCQWLEEEELEMLSIRRGTLSQEEKQKIEHHVEVTYKLLKGIKFGEHLKSVPEIAGNHHEYLDGTGYPRGLSGQDLSVEVRILTILDIFEALTAKDRPYKTPMPEEKAFSILNDMADGGKLDKKLVGLLQHCRLEKNTNEDN